ncbi:MAG TPA: GAF domain-containing protein, partial [Bryobacteraceae bacterium]
MSTPPEIRITARNVNLDNCDREQIQYSNAVQPHAVLLVLEPPSHKILQASANAGELGCGPAESLIGRPLEDIFDPDLHRRFSEAAAKLTQPAAPRHIACVEIAGQTRDIFAHYNDGLLLIELERQGLHLDVVESRLYAELRIGIAQLNTSTTVIEFLDQVVHVIARCTGFERVMAYRFHEDGSGQVVAEAAQEGLDRYLGLHYPAADIPRPARRLFGLTWLRHLPNVSYRPIPILPEINPVTGDVIDLSYAFSRSVSVMYTDYLKNMGVQATMVLTLFKGGKLWGLISCMQHSAPRHLNLEVRGICEMLAQTSSLLMSAKEDAELAAYRESLSASLQALMNQLTRAASINDSLTSGALNLLSAMDASGAAILIDDQVTLMGSTPSREAVLVLAAQLADKVKDVWSSDLLTRDIDADPAVSDTASGVLAARVGRFSGNLAMWFRPEYRQTVSWAGDPSKLVVKNGGNQPRLHPNGSFDVWRTEVRGRSKPWLDCEIEFASKLGRGILEVIVERSREVARLNKDLTRSNRELEEFVYTASHDLKSPLRGIATYAQLVLRG